MHPHLLLQPPGGPWEVDPRSAGCQAEERPPRCGARCPVRGDAASPACPGCYAPRGRGRPLADPQDPAGPGAGREPARCLSAEPTADGPRSLPRSCGLGDSGLAAGGGPGPLTGLACGLRRLDRPPGPDNEPHAPVTHVDGGLASSAALSRLRLARPRSRSPTPREPTAVPQHPPDARPSKQCLSSLCRDADSEVHRRGARMRLAQLQGPGSRGLLGGGGDCAWLNPPRKATDARKAKCSLLA